MIKLHNANINAEISFDDIYHSLCNEGSKTRALYKDFFELKMDHYLRAAFSPYL